MRASPGWTKPTCGSAKVPILATALREALEGARGLTGARCGAIATLGEASQPGDLLTSGLTDEARGRLIEQVRGASQPLRLADLPAYARSLGIVSDPILPKSFLATPIRHRGTDLGYFLLAEKADRAEFSGEDEGFLRLVASQAGAAIANLRTQRASERVRAHLEAMIETSPVGALVFDAGTGKVLSVNQEGKRLVEGLRMPGCTSEQLLEVLTFRRADGREYFLGEVPLPRELSTDETVRAEEIVVSVPDGRKATLMVNATPVRSADGTVVSKVVTVQDLAPIQELERLRGEFVGMVSHELRAPLTSIKGSATTLLETSSDLDPAEMREFFRIIVDQADHMRGVISDLLDAGRIDTGTLSVSPEPSDLASLVDRARNTFLSGGGLHTVLIDLAPELPRVMADRRRIVQVLNNLFSNAARHAPESSPIRVAALAGGRACCGLGLRPGQGRDAGAAAQAVSEVHRRRSGRRQARACRDGPGPVHLQGAGGSPWRPYPGRERRDGARHTGHLHPSGGRRGKRRAPLRSEPSESAG